MLISKDRITGIDLARGLAFCGMVLVNFHIVMAGFGSADHPIAQLFSSFSGRAASLFVMLAGVGIALRWDRASEEKKPAIRRSTIYRALFLLVCGYLLQALTWDGDILHYYGVYLLLTIPLLRLRSRWLLLIALLIVAIYIGLTQWIPWFRGWRLMTLSYPEFWEPIGQIRNLFYNGWHPVFPWLSFLLVGCCVGRLNLSSWKTALSLLIGGCLLALLAIEVSELAQQWRKDHAVANFFDPTLSLLKTESLPPGPFFVLSACGSGMALIGISLLMARAPRLMHQLLVQPFVVVGRRAFSLYILHVIVLMQFWGRLNELGSANSKTVGYWWLGMILTSMAGSLLLEYKQLRGPAEWAMRRLCDR